MGAESNVVRLAIPAGEVSGQLASSGVGQDRHPPDAIKSQAWTPDNLLRGRGTTRARRGQLLLFSRQWEQGPTLCVWRPAIKSQAWTPDIAPGKGRDQPQGEIRPRWGRTAYRPRRRGSHVSVREISSWPQFTFILERKFEKKLHV